MNGLNVFRTIEKIILLILMIFLFGTSVVYAADTTSDLIGKFTFDENIINEITGESAVTLNKGDGVVIEELYSKWTYTDGVKGNAICFKANGEAGLDLGIVPSNYKNYTISVWIKSFDENKDSPIVWMGRTIQNNKNFVGIINDTYGYLHFDYTNGPLFEAVNQVSRIRLHSNEDKGPVSVKNVPDAEKLTTYDWTNVTIVVEDRQGKLYYDGQFIADTGDAKVHNFFYDSTVSTFVGNVFWGDSFEGYIDELYMYDRALTDEDVAALVEETNVADVKLGEFEPFEQQIITDTDKIPAIYPNMRDTDRVLIWNLWFDLSDDELDALIEKADDIAGKYNINMYIEQGGPDASWYINAESSLNSLKSDYDIRYGENTDGIALLIDIYNDECQIYVSGKLKNRINPYGVRIIEKEIEALLRKNKLYEANDMAISLIDEFEKEATFMLPYIPLINPYIKSVWKVTTLFIVAVITIFAVCFIYTRLKNDKKYSKGRYRNDILEEQLIYHQIPYNIPFKVSKEEFIEHINEQLKLKYVPNRFIENVSFDNIMQLSNRYCVSLTQKNTPDTYRYGWTDNKDMCYRMINENTNEAVDELIKSVEPYECADIECVGMDKNRGGMEKIVALPLWMLDVKYNGSRFSFVMNGQTGKFLGQVPIDYRKIIKKTAIITAAVFAGLIVGSSLTMSILNLIYVLV